MNYYIIEHDKRGTLVELDPDKQVGATFSWSGARSDESTAKRFPSVAAAIRTRNQITNTKCRDECNIVDSNGWVTVA